MAGTDRKPEPDPPDAAPRWRRRAADRPREILDAALTVFVAKGFAATKLDDVAGRRRHLEGPALSLFRHQGGAVQGSDPAELYVTTIRDVGDRARASDSAVAALDVFLEQMIAVASDVRRSAM